MTDIKIEYEGGAGNDRRKFSLEITGLVLDGHDAYKTGMVERISAALAAGDAQWVIDLGNENVWRPRALDRP